MVRRVTTWYLHRDADAGAARVAPPRCASGPGQVRCDCCVPAAVRAPRVSGCKGTERPLPGQASDAVRVRARAERRTDGYANQALPANDQERPSVMPKAGLAGWNAARQRILAVLPARQPHAWRWTPVKPDRPYPGAAPRQRPDSSPPTAEIGGLRTPLPSTQVRATLEVGGSMMKRLTPLQRRVPQWPHGGPNRTL
jgi:hypothetical protein